MVSAAYSVHPTPLGQALIVITDEGLAALRILDDDARNPRADNASYALADLAQQRAIVPILDADATGSIRAQLDEYFVGQRTTFDVDIDWWFARDFARAALEAVREIPFGETASYGEVAALAGSPRAHRAVGSACARTAISLIIPAHRVVRSDGGIGEYGGHPEHKRYLLDHENAVARQNSSLSSAEG